MDELIKKFRCVSDVVIDGVELKGRCICWDEKMGVALLKEKIVELSGISLEWLEQSKDFESLSQDWESRDEMIMNQKNGVKYEFFTQAGWSCNSSWNFSSIHKYRRKPWSSVEPENQENTESNVELNFRCKSDINLQGIYIKGKEIWWDRSARKARLRSGFLLKHLPVEWLVQSNDFERLSQDWESMDQIHSNCDNGVLYEFYNFRDKKWVDTKSPSDVRTCRRKTIKKEEYRPYTKEEWIKLPFEKREIRFDGSSIINFPQTVCDTGVLIGRDIVTWKELMDGAEHTNGERCGVELEEDK